MAKKAFAEGTTLKEAALVLGLLTEEQFDDLGGDREYGRAQALISAPCRIALRKRSVAIAGHKTSISLEGVFWDLTH